MVKRMEDVSHLILDAPPAVVHASTSSAAPLVSSVRKAHSLQVPHLTAVSVCKVTVFRRHSSIPQMVASPVPPLHRKIASCPTGATLSLPGDTATRWSLPRGRLNKQTCSASLRRSDRIACAFARMNARKLQCLAAVTLCLPAP